MGLVIKVFGREQGSDRYTRKELGMGKEKMTPFQSMRLASQGQVERGHFHGEPGASHEE